MLWPGPCLATAVKVGPLRGRETSHQPHPAQGVEIILPRPPCAGSRRKVTGMMRRAAKYRISTIDSVPLGRRQLSPDSSVNLPGKVGGLAATPHLDRPIAISACCLGRRTLGGYGWSAGPRDMSNGAADSSRHRLPRLDQAA